MRYIIWPNKMYKDWIIDKSTTHKTVDNNDNNDNELLMIKNTNVIATHKATSEQTKDKVDVNEKVYRQLSKFDSLFNLQTRTNAEDQKSEGISRLNKPKLLFFPLKLLKNEQIIKKLGVALTKFIKESS
jgi:hypothetical protein